MDEYLDEIEALEYPLGFRQQMIALAFKPGWLSQHQDVLLPEYFPTPLEEEFVRSVVDYRTEFQMLPSEDDMLSMYNERYAGKHRFDNLTYDEYAEFTAEVYERIARRSPKAERDVIAWAQDQAMRVALITAVDYQMRGDYPRIREIISKALKVGKNTSDMGTELIGGASQWVSAYAEAPQLPTPWIHLNNIVGGVGSGELALFLAPAEGYKTTALVNIGYYAAGIVHRRDVLHISLEMSTQKSLMRYAYRMTFKPFDNTYLPSEYIKEMFEHARKKLRGRIKVKQYPERSVTVGDLKDYIKDLQDQDYDPSLLIVDYPALLKPSRAHKDTRLESRDIHEELRGMAVELGKPIWGGLQGNRASFSKEVLNMQDMAEDISPARTADLIISGNQTREEATVNKMRLWPAKVRERKPGSVLSQVAIEIKYPALIDTGVVKYKEKEDPKGSVKSREPGDDDNYE